MLYQEHRVHALWDNEIKDVPSVEGIPAILFLIGRAVYPALALSYSLQLTEKCYEKYEQ